MGRRKLRNSWVEEAIDALSVWYNKRQTNTLVIHLFDNGCPTKLYAAIHYQIHNKKCDWQIKMNTPDKCLIIHRLGEDNADGAECHLVLKDPNH